jgi:hypothetical protein
MREKDNVCILNFLVVETKLKLLLGKLLRILKELIN